MKKLVLVVAVLMLLGLTTMSEATGLTCDGPFAGILNKCIEAPEAQQSIVGVKLDMPNLIRFSKNWTLGLEGGKDLYSDVFTDQGYWLEDDKGYFGYLKITYSGTLFSFGNK